MLGLFKKKDLPIEILIERIQEGDLRIRNQCIESYRPFILATASELCKRYIQLSDDEYSVALIAFNEAITAYQAEKGLFLPFARRVIHNRLIDFHKKESKQSRAISLDAQDVEYEKEESNRILIHSSIQLHLHEMDARSRKEEIEQYSNALQEYGLSFSELVNVSPKHRDSREQAIALAKQLFAQEELREYVQQNKKIPVKRLMQSSGVGEKMIERNRKFILSIFVLLTDEYPYMQDYLSLTKEG